MADQSNSKPKTKANRSNNKGRSSKKQIVDAQLSMMENLAMINVRRFGLKGVDRKPFNPSEDLNDDQMNAAAPNDQPKESD